MTAVGSRQRLVRRAAGSLRGLARRVPGVAPSRRLRLSTRPDQHTEPRLVFLVPDYPRPSGGIKVMYEHVDALNAAGLPAVVMHDRAGFRCSWFPNTTKVTDRRSTVFGPQDVLVVPELCVDMLAGSGAKVSHIVLNQSGHLTWEQGGDAVAGHMVDNPLLLGTVVVSEHSRAYLEYAYPAMMTRVARNRVDPSLFYCEGGTGPRRLSYLRRRNYGDVEQAIRMLQARGSLAGWELAPIEPGERSVYAQALRRTRIFVSTPYQEGFCLPPLEAMASGAYVIGYSGYGGAEYFDPAFSALVPTGDVIALAQEIERAVQHDSRDCGWCTGRGAAASAFVTARYSAAAADDDIVRAYTEIVHASGLRS